MLKKEIPPKCIYCGQFIKYNEIEIVEFIPDTPFGPEEITFKHKDKHNEIKSDSGHQ